MHATVGSLQARRVHGAAGRHVILAGDFIGTPRDDVDYATLDRLFR